MVAKIGQNQKKKWLKLVKIDFHCFYSKNRRKQGNNIKQCQKCRNITKKHHHPLKKKRLILLLFQPHLLHQPIPLLGVLPIPHSPVPVDRDQLGQSVVAQSVAKLRGDEAEG